MKVLTLGPTGMIGRLVLQHGLSSDKITQVVSLTRRPTRVHHAKLKEILVDDFLQLDAYVSDLEGIDVI